MLQISDTYTLFHSYFNIMEPFYSYSEFEVLIILILNNTYDVIDFDSA